MTDEEFASAVERCEVPNQGFHHRDHLRLAWIYVHRYGDDAGARIGETIRRFAAHHGKSDKYHETVTQAWMQLVAHAVKADASLDAEALVKLLEPVKLAEYYSEAVLKSDTARAEFVAPDLKALP